MKRRRKKTGIDLFPMHAAIQMCLPCIVWSLFEGCGETGKKKYIQTSTKQRSRLIAGDTLLGKQRGTKYFYMFQTDW